GRQVYESLSEEIMATPLPKELSAEQVAEVQESLTKMAEPFREKAAAYQELVAKQQQLLGEQPTGEKNEEKSAQPKKVPLAEVKAHLKALNKDPDNRQAIQALYRVYKDNDHPRVAAYFEGRLNTLQGGE